MSCAAWAKQGDCKNNAGFMLKACPTSCGLCTPTCKDVHEDCTGWTTAGCVGHKPERKFGAVAMACADACACVLVCRQRVRREPQLYAQALPRVVRRVP